MTIQLVLNKNKKLKTVAASFRFFKLLGSSNGQTFSIHLFSTRMVPKNFCLAVGWSEICSSGVRLGWFDSLVTRRVFLHWLCRACFGLVWDLWSRFGTFRFVWAAGLGLFDCIGSSGLCRKGFWFALSCFFCLSWPYNYVKLNLCLVGLVSALVDFTFLGFILLY